MRKPLAVALFAGITLASWASASEISRQVAQQIDAASYRSYLEDELYTHDGDSRGPSGAEHDLARDNIATIFESFGLDVEYHQFEKWHQPWYNIVATQPGVLYPEIQYVVGAHYDSVSNPGADDNASGVAGVLEIARVLSQYDLPYTIKYIAFDLEELGLCGANAYVADHLNDDIRGMVNLDMIAWAGADNNVDIYVPYTAPILRYLMTRAVNEYGGGITITFEGEFGSSDNRPFSYAGFEACLLIEDRHGVNPCYHQECDSTDNPGYLDYEFGANITRAVAAFLVDPDAMFCPGDVNLDSRVDIIDLAGLLSNYGQASDADWRAGDLDGDGDVELSDLALLLAHYGSDCSAE